jgi:hypothetical protein
LVIVPSSFLPSCCSSLSYFTSFRELRATLLLRFFFAPARFVAFRENRSPQAKIAGCAPLRWRLFLPRLRNTPASANVRADVSQRKEKIEEFFVDM